MIEGKGKYKTKKGVTDSFFRSTVGAKGFEPSTPCSQSRCASRTAPYPEKKDDATIVFFLRGEGGIRTPGTHCWIRQFSKLLVSATHPPLLGCELRCKNSLFSFIHNRFSLLFLKKFRYSLNYSAICSIPDSVFPLAIKSGSKQQNRLSEK